jgi:hypothetical protein
MIVMAIKKKIIERKHTKRHREGSKIYVVTRSYLKYFLAMFVQHFVLFA